MIYFERKTQLKRRKFEIGLKIIWEPLITIQ